MVTATVSSLSVNTVAERGGGGSVNGSGLTASNGATNTAISGGINAGGLDLSAEAYGGYGGSGSVAGANGGNGGNGIATASGTSSTADYVSVDASATGGLGGSAGAGGINGTPGTGIASARGVSTGGGQVDVTANGQGGTGANFGTAGVNGGAGAAESLTNAVSGSTTGELDLDQAAAGGVGGEASSATTGNGGNATSMLTASNPGGGPLTGEASATGGNGGTLLGATGTAGNGGNAVATITLTSGTDVTAIASATGGNAGSHFSGGTGGAGGTASATATANGTVAGIAEAQSFVNAVSGSAVATAFSAGGSITSLEVSSTAPAAKVSQALVLSSVGQPDPGLSTLSGVQSGAVVTGLPQASDVNAALTGQTVLMSAGISATDTVAIVDLGGAYSTSGSGASTTYTSVANFTFSTLPSGHLELGLVTGTATGNGFGSLTFTLTEGGVQKVNQTFASFGSVGGYFTDDALNLGSFSGNTTVDFSFTYTSSNAGDSYATEMVLADIPEPGSVVADVPGRRDCRSGICWETNTAQIASPLTAGPPPAAGLETPAASVLSNHLAAGTSNPAMNRETPVCRSRLSAPIRASQFELHNAVFRADPHLCGPILRVQRFCQLRHQMHIQHPAWLAGCGIRPAIGYLE